MEISIQCNNNAFMLIGKEEDFHIFRGTQSHFSNMNYIQSSSPENESS